MPARTRKKERRSLQGEVLSILERAARPPLAREALLANIRALSVRVTPNPGGASAQEIMDEVRDGRF